VILDISTEEPCWIHDGLVISAGWLKTQPMTPTAVAAVAIISAAHLEERGVYIVDPRLAQYELFQPQVLTVAPLLGVVEHPARTLPFAKPLSQMLTGIATIYFADYGEATSCRTLVCQAGIFPARTTYANVLSGMRAWTPPAAVLAELGDNSPPDHVALMVPASDLGCPCGKPSQFKCATSLDDCRTQCCAECAPTFRKLRPCGECGLYVCYGHSAACVGCGERYCVDKACIANIADYCPFCFQPLCADCIVHHDCM